MFKLTRHLFSHVVHSTASPALDIKSPPNCQTVTHQPNLHPTLVLRITSDQSLPITPCSDFAHQHPAPAAEHTVTKSGTEYREAFYNTFRKQARRKTALSGCHIPFECDTFRSNIACRPCATCQLEGRSLHRECHCPGLQIHSRYGQLKLDVAGRFGASATTVTSFLFYKSTGHK